MMAAQTAGRYLAFVMAATSGPAVPSGLTERGAAGMLVPAQPVQRAGHPRDRVTMLSGPGSGVPADQARELRRVKRTMEPLGNLRKIRQLGCVTFKVGYQPRRQPRLPLAREQPEQVRAAVALTVSPRLNRYRAHARPPQVSHRQPMLAAHLLSLVQQAPRLAHSLLDARVVMEKEHRRAGTRKRFRDLTLACFRQDWESTRL